LENNAAELWAAGWELTDKHRNRQTQLNKMAAEIFGSRYFGQQ